MTKLAVGYFLACKPQPRFFERKSRLEDAETRVHSERESDHSDNSVYVHNKA